MLRFGRLEADNFPGSFDRTSKTCSHPPPLKLPQLDHLLEWSGTSSVGLLQLTNLLHTSQSLTALSQALAYV
jgi:hypothetical protein